MKFIRQLFVALCLMLTFSVSGAIEFVGHDCHDEDAAAATTDECTCVCVCCHAETAPAPSPDSLYAVLEVPVLASRALTGAGDTGRLLESFIFTPPRA